MYTYTYSNWPLPSGAFQDQCKQTKINKYSNKHNQIKNPNWREADQSAIYKRSREDELGATENNISQQSEQDLNLRSADFKSSTLATRPHTVDDDDDDNDDDDKLYICIEQIC